VGISIAMFDYQRVNCESYMTIYMLFDLLVSILPCCFTILVIIWCVKSHPYLPYPIHIHTTSNYRYILILSLDNILHEYPIKSSHQHSIPITGWWLTYPSEKYEFVNGKDNIPYMKWTNKKKCSKMFQATNQPLYTLWLFNIAMENGP
jgi:hypothetical protein